MSESSAEAPGLTLVLLTETPDAWAERSAARLPEFLADHAVCELQASVFALSLVGMYPDNDALMDRLSALAAEELGHFRRIAKETRRLGVILPTKRRNAYVAALRAACRSGAEPAKGLDLLLVAALIEARSHERFLKLASHLRDERLVRLYRELADDEARHGPIYLELAVKHAGLEATVQRLDELLPIEARALSGGPGREIAVHAAV
ncbi:MAG: tRNA isopentenyl-2-thiomethyl-A-37 hydroxylase MiaE [Thermoanaerobaculia bacterium]